MHQKWLIGGGKHLFRLFYQTTRLKTLTPLINLDYSKSEKCSGGQLNLSKIRITGLAAPNTVGDKLPMFVTGKTKKPKVLQEGGILPCRYRNQLKSWMDGVLFEMWAREMDKKFISDGRKVILMIDHCPSLSQNWSVCFSSNQTQTQSMNQDVIGSPKNCCELFSKGWNIELNPKSRHS